MFALVCTLTLVAIITLRLFRRHYGLTTLRGKSLLITGCDTGFGHLMAIQFSQAGAHVFAACLTPESAASLKTPSNTDGKITSFVMDVTDDKKIEKGVELVQAELRESKRRLYAVISNAGIAAGSFVELTPLDTYKRVMEVNFFGCVRVIKAFLPLIQSPGGRIVGVTSNAALLAGESYSPYASSKFALTAFLDSLRRELAPSHIKVIKILLGAHKTPMFNSPQLQSGTDPYLAAASRNLQERYADRVRKVTTAWRNYLKFAADAQNVINSVKRALLPSHPPPSILVGYDAVFMWKPVSLLPETWADALLRLAG